MKLKEYFKKPEYFICACCDAKIKLQVGFIHGGWCLDCTQFCVSYNNNENGYFECRVIQILQGNIQIALYSGTIFIFKDKCELIIPFDSLNSEKDIKEFDREWAMNLLVFS